MNILEIAKNNPDKTTAVFLGVVEAGVEQKSDGLTCFGIHGLDYNQVVALIRNRKIDNPIFTGINAMELRVYQDMLREEGILPILLGV